VADYHFLGYEQANLSKGKDAKRWTYGESAKDHYGCQVADSQSALRRFLYFLYYYHLHIVTQR